MNASNVFFYHGLVKPGSVLIVPVGWMVAEAVRNSKACCGMMLPFAGATPSCIASYARLARPLQEFRAKVPKNISPPVMAVVETYEDLLDKCGEAVPEINLEVMPMQLEKEAANVAQDTFPNRATAAKAKILPPPPPF